jgi:general secretion pathway protein C
VPSHDPKMSERWQRLVALALGFAAFATAIVALIVAIERRGAGEPPRSEPIAPIAQPARPRVDPAAAVRRVDATHVEISRAAVDEVLADPDQLAALARATPVTGGFRLDAIRAGSLLDRLGLRDGDIIRGVEGMDVSTPAAALEVYQQLRSANRLTIDLARGGSAMQISIAIR